MALTIIWVLSCYDSSQSHINTSAIQYPKGAKALRKAYAARLILTHDGPRTTLVSCQDPVLTDCSFHMMGRAPISRARLSLATLRAKPQTKMVTVDYAGGDSCLGVTYETEDKTHYLFKFTALEGCNQASEQSVRAKPSNEVKR